MLYYPEAGFGGLYDEKAGVCFFRNRWQDGNDLHLSVMADITHRGNARDQAEALQLVLNGPGNSFGPGLGKYRNAALFGTLLVNGLNHPLPDGSGLTGSPGYARFTRDGGGYVMVGGGPKYDSLGVKMVNRRVRVDFSSAAAPAIISVLDDIRSGRENRYAWNLNPGRAQVDFETT